MLIESTQTGAVENPYTEEILAEPLRNYEAFEKYLAHLNRQLSLNMPFLRAKFGVTTISIFVALKEGGLLPDNMRKVLFDKSLSKTTVLVQFTKIDDPRQELQ